MSHRQLHTQTQETDIFRCVMLIDIMGLVCYFVCPELVFAEAQKSCPHTVGMTFRAPEEFWVASKRLSQEIPGRAQPSLFTFVFLIPVPGPGL